MGNKKIGSILCTVLLVTFLFGCGSQDTQTSSNTSNKKIMVTQQADEDVGKTETKIISGELFDKITSVMSVKEVIVIEDTTLGFKNLNININVNKGTAVGELASYRKNVAKIENSLELYFFKSNYTKIAYVMNVENEMKNVYIIYKKQDSKYMLESAAIFDEVYKKAALNM